MKAHRKAGENLKEDLDMLENRLQAVMLPVAPRPEYVRELRRRLVSGNDLEIDEVKPAGWKSTLLTAAGLLSGTLLIVLGVRAVISLLNSLGVMQQIKSQMQPKCPTPVQPVA